MAAGWMVKVDVVGPDLRRTRPTFVVNCEDASDARQAVLGFLGLAADEERLGEVEGAGRPRLREMQGWNLKNSQPHATNVEPVQRVSEAAMAFMALSEGRVARWS